MSADTFVSVTGTSNASLGSFAAVAGNFVAVSSSKTGSGSYLPMAFFTSAAERVRILTTGVVLVNRTTNDGTTSIFQASGAISASGGYIANGAVGQSVTTTVRDAAGTGTCTLIFTLGIKTGGTC